MNENLSDPIRRLNEWALTTGRLHQSPQTKFVHYFYGRLGGEKAHTIPIYDNALFALALLRSRLIESVQEAKQLLRHLLAFQIQTEGFYQGSFPIYLHDYPDCQDSTVALRLLTPFYWIIKQFGHVLGSELKQQIENAANQALNFCLRCQAQKPFSYPLTVRLTACEIAYKQMNTHALLDALADQQLETWHTTSQLADILVGLQMVVTDLSHSPWAPLWHRMADTWHQGTGSYMGPHIREWDTEGEPKPSLYDLYCGYFSSKFTARAQQHELFQLQGVLIQPTEDRFDSFIKETTLQAVYKEQKWQTALFPTYAWNLLDKNHFPNPSLDKTWTPFRFIWGDLQKMYSFVCQGGQVSSVQTWHQGNELFLMFELPEMVFDETSHKERVIEFYISYVPAVSLMIEDRFANTFKFGELLQLDLGNHRFTMQWSLLEGEGDFFGHWMYGNRPSQIEQDKEHLKAYDWTLFLRALRRQGKCRIQVKLTLQD